MRTWISDCTGSQVNPRSILRDEPLHYYCIDNQLAHEEVVWHRERLVEGVAQELPSHSSLPLVLSPLHPDKLLDLVSDRGCRVVAVGAEIVRCCLVIHDFIFHEVVDVDPSTSDRGSVNLVVLLPVSSNMMS